MYPRQWRLWQYFYLQLTSGHIKMPLTIFKDTKRLHDKSELLSFEILKAIRGQRKGWVLQRYLHSFNFLHYTQVLIYYKQQTIRQKLQEVYLKGRHLDGTEAAQTCILVALRDSHP